MTGGPMGLWSGGLDKTHTETEDGHQLDDPLILNVFTETGYNRHKIGKRGSHCWT